MSEYLDSIREVQNVMRDSAFELDNLADAFDITGNNQVCDILHDIATRLHSSSKELNESVTTELINRKEEAEQSACNTVLAALAMSEMKGK